MDAKSLDDLDIKELPTPPQGALAVVRACSEDDMDADQISLLVEQVPALSVELLRLANSAYFGFSANVTSIARAVALIGRRVLKNISLCIAMKAALKADQLPAFPINEFWEMALRRAVCARLLATETGLDRDTSFTVGLLQDFGLLVLFYINPKVTGEWARLAELTPDTRYEQEQKLFNTTHDRIGLKLARSWSLPDELIMALGYHHRSPPHNAENTASGYCRLAQSVDWMAAVFTASNRRKALKHSRRLLSDYYHIDSGQADLLMDSVANSMQESGVALGFDLGTQASFETIMGEANLHLVDETMSFQQMNWHLEHTLEERDRIAAELDKELELAREVQRSLLPDETEQFKDITGINISAKAVSGDFYDFFSLHNGQVAFCIADVSGKGMNAALLMAKTSSLFHCLGKSILDPAKLLTMLNREILDTSIHGMFVTMLAGVYDPQSRLIRIANAGHLPAILMKNGKFHSEYPALAPPLGIIPEVSFTLDQIQLTENAQLYLYTDGLLEARVNNEKMLEQKGLLALLEKYSDTSPVLRLQHIVGDLRSSGSMIDDDLTILLLEG